VDFRHQACASEIIWKFNDNAVPSNPCMRSTIPGGRGKLDPAQRFRSERKFSDSCRNPPVYEVFSDVQFILRLSVFLVKPAFYLWLSLIMIAAAGLNAAICCYY
jgi:hypothetical protein